MMMQAPIIQNNIQGYYQNPIPQQIQQMQLPHNVSNILFVADLPEDTAEEDLSLFFKEFGFRCAKIYKYYRVLTLVMAQDPMHLFISKQENLVSG